MIGAAGENWGKVASRSREENVMSPSGSPVEVAEIGGLSCLYRGDTGALTLVNPAAQLLWQKLRAGGDATGELAALAAAWRDLGLLATTAPAPVAADQPSGAMARSRAKPAWDATYALGNGRKCRLTVETACLADLLAAVLRPLETSRGDICTTIEILGGLDGSFSLLVDGALRFMGGLAAVRSEALRHLLLGGSGWERVGALLHASTVAGEAGGIALLGASGSGKSTLAAELVAHGCRYVADDLSALDRRGSAALPFPLGLSVKSGSWATVGRHFAELAAIEPLVTRRHPVRYLDLRHRAVPATAAVPLVQLVFPIYMSGAALEVERLSPETALQLAIATGSEPDGTPRSIHPLARLCTEVPAWHIAYCDVAEAARWIVANAGQTP